MACGGKNRTAHSAQDIRWRDGVSQRYDEETVMKASSQNVREQIGRERSRYSLEKRGGIIGTRGRRGTDTSVRRRNRLQIAK
jgi:hypothetical protein